MIEALTSGTVVEAVGLLVAGWLGWELATVGLSFPVRVDSNEPLRRPVSVYEWASLRQARARAERGESRT